MKKSGIISDLCCGLAFLLIAIALALFITLNLRPLYYYDIDYLNIPERSGMDRDTIIANYNALIDYYSVLNTEPLVFPTLKQSNEGQHHFLEVKYIFNTIFGMGFAGLLVFTSIGSYKAKRRQWRFMKVSAITGIAVPAVFAAFTAINFNRLFIKFHESVFNNDDWIFYPSRDPVIMILPEDFFMHCLISIIIIICVLSVLTYCMYRLMRVLFA